MHAATGDRLCLTQLQIPAPIFYRRAGQWGNFLGGESSTSVLDCATGVPPSGPRPRVRRCRQWLLRAHTGCYSGAVNACDSSTHLRCQYTGSATLRHLAPTTSTNAPSEAETPAKELLQHSNRKKVDVNVNNLEPFQKYLMELKEILTLPEHSKTLLGS